MKKLSLIMVLVLLLASFFSGAQLNYLLSAEIKNYTPLAGGTVPILRKPPFINTL